MALGVNNNQTTNQEVNVLTNMGAVAHFAKEIKELAQDALSPKEKAKAKDPVSLVLDSDTSKDAGMTILREMVAKMVNSGVVLPGARPLIKEPGAEKELMKDKLQPEDKDGDTAFVSSFSSKKTSLRTAVKQMNFKSGADKGAGQAKEAAETLMREYAAVFYEHLTGERTGTKKELKRLEQELKARGFSDEKIFDIQKQARVMVKADLFAKIKELLVMKELSGSKAEEEMLKHSILSFADEIDGGRKIFGNDGKGKKSEMQAFVDNAGKAAKRDLAEFSLEELESTLMRKMMGGSEDEKAISKMLDLCKKYGVRLGKWSKEWNEKKEHLGLNLMLVPDGTAGLSVNADSDGNDKRKKEPEPNDEASLLVDKLTAAYIHRLMHGGLQEAVSSYFEIRRLKKGLITMGIYCQELDTMVDKVARKEAKERVITMLEEAFLEKAALFSTKGRAAKLLKIKIKSALDAAARLGMKLDESDLERMRYKASVSIKETAERQIEIYEPILRKVKIPGLEKDYKRLKALIERLEGEMRGRIEPARVLPDMRSEIA